MAVPVPRYEGRGWRGFHHHGPRDQGTTWALNGSSTGIVAATADSTQPQPKFGTVNALLGGVDHAAVDPTLLALADEVIE